jgi:hypothetical protein
VVFDNLDGRWECGQIISGQLIAALKMDDFKLRQLGEDLDVAERCAIVKIEVLQVGQGRQSAYILQMTTATQTEAF